MCVCGGGGDPELHVVLHSAPLPRPHALFSGHHSDPGEVARVVRYWERGRPRGLY